MMINTHTTETFFKSYLEHFNHYQSTYLLNLNFPDKLLQDAVIYSLDAPGKKFRAMLVYATGALFELPNTYLDPLALAIEMIHAYSLVHDDLPAMDNDDWRRGRPSCHKAFDEATAILAGNALNHLAFHLLLTELSPIDAQNICLILYEKIGPLGILSGQSMDLKLLIEGQHVSLDTLTHIHHLKTTSLLQAVVLSVASLAKAEQKIKENLFLFAKHLGLAYQMFDDFGDIYATAEWGKKQASDASNKKYTFVQYLEYDKLQQAIKQELDKAKCCLLDTPHSQYLIHMLEQLEYRLNTLPTTNQRM